ncbi:MAG TPA: 2-C-methyl-D-erythritol 4-phosphate cytidylyltransferase [Thermoanaerobaculia bacterium]|nr:2-C-methyl-D-erythritol 4-phosphate cytidylyltransferase [Thermoanaerobaculia bacterium]
MAALLLIVAAGSGTRLGRPEPKGLVPLAGRPLLSWTVDAFRPGRFSRAVVTAPPDRLEAFSRVVGDFGRVVAGGETRAASVRRGVEALAPGDDDIVAIHDAARPFVSAEEVLAVLRAAEEIGAAIAAVPVVDTIKRVADGRIVETVDRSTLYGAATPQAFRASVLRRAIASGEEATDEAALCEKRGDPVAVVPVSRRTFKITTPEDLELAEAILARRQR